MAQIPKVMAQTYSQPRPLYESSSPFAALEAAMRKDWNAASAIARQIEMERTLGWCADCGNISNPDHGVQAGGFCACDHSAKCYRQDEGHVPRGEADEHDAEDKTTCCECSTPCNFDGVAVA